MGTLEKVQRLGQSIWYDNISRDLLASGEIERLIETGITGLTSNPTIFEKAIAGSSAYDDALTSLALEGLAPRTATKDWLWRTSAQPQTCCARHTTAPAAETATPAWRLARPLPTTPRPPSPKRSACLPPWDAQTQ